jgi:hypothetical protein
VANAYTPNQPVRVSVAFTVNGTPADPTTVTLQVKDPTKTMTSYTYALAQVVKDSVGNYHYDVTPTVSGTWFYGWTSTGTAAADAEAFFTVLPSVVT